MVPSFPCIVQQYHNHHERFFKVYVIGGDVMVYQRPSLPDLHGIPVSAGRVKELDSVASVFGNGKTEGLVHCIRSVIFDSRKEYPKWEDFHFPTAKVADSPTASRASPSCEAGAAIDAEVVEKCKAAAVVIQHEFSLSLFGFDVIVPAVSNPDGSQDILVIDVNFFPSYKEVGDFPQRLCALLRQKAGLPPWGAVVPVAL